MATVTWEPLAHTLSKQLPAVLLGHLYKHQMSLLAALEPSIVFRRLIP